MSLVGIIASLCTLTSEPQHAEASGSAFHERRFQPIVRHEPGRPSKAPRPSAVAPASVIGRVVDALGNAVADVTVIASPSEPGSTRATTRARTDRSGRFRFAGLAPGEYVFVTIHGDHAATVSPAMPIEPGNAAGLEVVLIVGGSSLSA
jgi:protocatechuate 3,4-dioxygenase beta subunit